MAALVVVMASTASVRRVPRDHSYLFTDAISTIDSPESLAEYEQVINGQMDKMKIELTSTNGELEKYEDEFKKELDKIQEGDA